MGLTNDYRNVVLAGNLGNQEGAGSPSAGYNGYVMIVNATGFTAVNLTILNYCNLNYEYPGNAALDLTERSPSKSPATKKSSTTLRYSADSIRRLSRARVHTSTASTSKAQTTSWVVELKESGKIQCSISQPGTGKEL
jgi:hypothetical protein